MLFMHTCVSHTFMPTLQTNNHPSNANSSAKHSLITFPIVRNINIVLGSCSYYVNGLEFIYLYISIDIFIQKLDIEQEALVRELKHWNSTLSNSEANQDFTFGEVMKLGIGYQKQAGHYHFLEGLKAGMLSFVDGLCMVLCEVGTIGNSFSKFFSGSTIFMIIE